MNSPLRVSCTRGQVSCLAETLSDRPEDEDREPSCSRVGALRFGFASGRARAWGVRVRDHRAEGRRRRSGVARHLRAVSSGEAGGQPAAVAKVLVAEDNPSLRETMSQILSSEGYAVEEAGDGETALEILGQSDLDVVLLDLTMPRMSGMELLEAIDAPPPMVIVYSAFEHMSLEELERRARSKVFRSLRKPVPPAELVSVVAEALSSSTAGTAL